MIIGFANQKGGVGKTTLSIHVAAALAHRGHSVLLIDADIQNSALDWACARHGELNFSVMGNPTPTIHKEIKLLRPKYDYIIIDAPPRLGETLKSIIVACDKIVIPLTPSPYDIWAADNIVNLIKEIQSLTSRTDQDVCFVINQKMTNTIIAKDSLEALKEYELPVCKSEIHRRTIFARMAAQGETVFDSSFGNVASREIEKLAKELTNDH